MPGNVNVDANPDERIFADPKDAIAGNKNVKTGICFFSFNYYYKKAGDVNERCTILAKERRLLKVPTIAPQQAHPAGLRCKTA